MIVRQSELAWHVSPSDLGAIAPWMSASQGPELQLRVGMMRSALSGSAFHHALDLMAAVGIDREHIAPANCCRPATSAAQPTILHSA
jgi:hypothetical protein